MTTGKTLAWAGLIGLIGLVSPAAAHHSFAMFDQTKLLNTKGMVSQFRWTNPHTYLYAHDASGTKWAFEGMSPNHLVRFGWSKRSVQPGDQIDITYYPLRTGQPGGMLKTVTLPGGQTLSAW